MPRVALTIPCFNEEQRFCGSEFERLFTDPRIHLCFVDDGSTDGTCAVLEQFVATAPAGRATLLRLPSNAGKSEAVRQGMNQGVEAGFDIVGFADADLATPAAEVMRLVRAIADSDARVVLGSRRFHPGGRIQRRAHRRYLGRVFSSVGSAILRESIHDTQCGAKLFRTTGPLRRALAEPFRSRWAFDVELLGRVMIESAGELAVGRGILEVDLEEWVEVPGSKLGMSSMLKAGVDLALVALDLARLRRG